MSSETSTAAPGSGTQASGASAQAASSSAAGEELNLIPQWLKRGPSASPRHAQAPPPPPAPANPQRERSIGNSGSSSSRNTESRGDRQMQGGDRDRERTGGGGRFQSFVQSEQQRRPPQASASGASLQGTFEGGRFTMPGSDSGQDSRIEPRGGRGGGGRGDYHRHPPATGGRGGDYSQQERPPRVGRSAHGGESEYQSWRDLPSTSATNRIQYARDELLDMAVPSSLESAQLSSETPEGIISAEWIEPELKKPFDSEEIYNAWYESLQSERSGRGQARGGGGGGPPGAGSAIGQTEGPPRVDWRNPPNWRAAPQVGGGQSRSDMRTFGNLNNNDARGSILPPSGGMGLDKMAEAAEKFAREMQEMAKGGGGGMMFGKPEASKATPPAQLQGLLGEKTGNSILDEPLEEGLDAPPEEEVVPKEEAIDYDGVNDEEKLIVPPPSSSSSSKQHPETMSMKRVQDELPSVQIPQVKLPDLGGGMQQPSSMLPQVPLVSLEAFKPAMGGAQNPSHFGTSTGGPASTLPRMMDPWGASNPLEHAAGRGSALMAGLGGGLDLLSPGGVFPPSMPSQMKPSQHLPSSPQPQPQSQQMRTSTLLPPARPPVVGGVGMMQGGLFGQMPQPSPQAPQQQAKMMPPYPGPTQSQMVDEWFYKDPQNAIQGPFSSLEMKEWLEAGYFKPDLPISYGQHGTGKFVPLAALYSDIRSAFIIPPPKMGLGGGMPGATPGSNAGGMGALPASLGPTIMPMAQAPLPQSIPSQQQQAMMQHQQQQQQMAAAKQRMMEEQQRAAQQQQQQHHQQQAAALEQQQRAAQQEEQRQKEHQQERLKREAEEKARKEADEAEKQQKAQQAAQQQNAAKSKPAAATPAWSTAPQPPQAPTLAQIRAEEERLKKEQEKQKQQQPPPQKASAAATATSSSNAATTPAGKTAGGAAAPWGKSAQEAIRTPTLKEIQEAEEEERKRQQQSKEQPPLTMASHLAKAAGIETRTWSAQVASASGTTGNEPKKAIPQTVLAPPPTQQQQQQQQRPAQAAKSAGSTSASASKQSSSPSTGAGASQAQQQASSKKESEVVYNANAQMSAELKAWCQENAPKIGADMALLEFCYGMENSEEVRETFTGYLGLKPQVTSFVDEYLRRVNLDRASDPRAAHDASGEWKDAKGATGKAGKKKRG